MWMLVVTYTILTLLSVNLGLLESSWTLKVIVKNLALQINSPFKLIMKAKTFAVVTEKSLQKKID